MHPPPTPIHLTPTTGNRAAMLERLVEELTAAHEDTVLLATGPATGLEWQVHLDYLRAMQRLARESLARMHDTAGAASA